MVESLPVRDHDACTRAPRSLLDGPQACTGVMRGNIDKQRTGMERRVRPLRRRIGAEHAGQCRAGAPHQVVGSGPRDAPDPDGVQAARVATRLANASAIGIDSAQCAPRQMDAHGARVDGITPPIVQAGQRQSTAERGIDHRPSRGDARNRGRGAAGMDRFPQEAEAFPGRGRGCAYGWREGMHGARRFVA